MGGAPRSSIWTHVALVEKERISGDCTNYGCVPSNALLSAARVAWHLRTADRFGFDSVQPSVDLGRVMAEYAGPWSASTRQTSVSF